MTAATLTPAQARPSAVADGVEKAARATKYGDALVAPIVQSTPAQFELELGHWER